MVDLTGLVKVQKKYKEKGLVILAMHRGEEPIPTIVRVARLKKWPYPIYTGGTVKGYELGTNPQPFIFNHKGKMVFDPKYGVDIHKKTVKFASKAPDWLVGDRKFEHLGAQSRSIARHRNFGESMTGLEEKVKSAEGKEKEEAEYLLGRLKWYADWLNAKAKEKIEDGRPSEALNVLKEIATLFRGHEIGTKADEEQKEKKADKAFKDELAAGKQVKTIEDAFYKIKPKASGGDSAKWEKRYGRYIKQLGAKYKALKKKYSETKVFQRVKGLVAELRLD